MHHSDLHSLRTRFPSLRLRCFHPGVRQRRLHGGGRASAERSTLTLTFQHARLHKAADNHTAAPQTHSHATGLARRADFMGLGGLQEEPALESLAGSDK